MQMMDKLGGGTGSVWQDISEKEAGAEIPPAQVESFADAETSLRRPCI
jgi:hypothetical protein